MLRLISCFFLLFSSQAFAQYQIVDEFRGAAGVVSKIKEQNPLHSDYENKKMALDFTNQNIDSHSDLINQTSDNIKAKLSQLSLACLVEKDRTAKTEAKLAEYDQIKSELYGDNKQLTSALAWRGRYCKNAKQRKSSNCKNNLFLINALRSKLETLAGSLENANIGFKKLREQADDAKSGCQSYNSYFELIDLFQPETLSDITLAKNLKFKDISSNIQEEYNLYFISKQNIAELTYNRDILQKQLDEILADKNYNKNFISEIELTFSDLIAGGSYKSSDSKRSLVLKAGDDFFKKYKEKLGFNFEGQITLPGILDYNGIVNINHNQIVIMFETGSLLRHNTPNFTDKIIKIDSYDQLVR